MSFERALRDNPAPGSVGDVELRYDAPVLVGEGRGVAGPIRWLPGVLLLAALALGLGALLTLIADPAGPIHVPLAQGLGAGLAVALGGRLERHTRHRRRFVLHFADETVRVDLQGGLWRRPISRTWPFDAVKGLYVVEKRGGVFSLWMEAAKAPGSARTVPVLLVDGVPADDVEALRRLWTTLRAAFGLTRRPTEG
ncbi:MAG: hypothetical protein IRZ16_07930 [Myxococcaceae bacterium]|nr:hypothetical protein [Myxococcaceae bacterium]